MCGHLAVLSFTVGTAGLIESEVAWALLPGRVAGLDHALSRDSQMYEKGACDLLGPSVVRLQGSTRITELMLRERGRRLS